MSNPFSEVFADIQRKAAESRPEQGEEGINIFVEAFRGDFTPFKLDLERTAAKEAFEGFKVGVFRPFQVLTGKPEEIGSDHPLATTLGELGGILVSFIPVFKATQIALKGVGLTARLSPTVARMVQGSVAFGAFEAGAGELKGVPGRFATGAAVGLAFEGALIGGALAYRGGRAALRRAPWKVDPDAIRLETALHPNETTNPEEIVSKLINIGRPDKQLETLTAEIAALFKPNGIAIIPGVKNAERFVSFLRKQLPDVEFHIRPTEGGFFEVLTVDTRVDAPQLLRRLQIERPPIIAFPGRGARVLSLQDAIKLVERPTAEGVGIPVSTTRGTQPELAREFFPGKTKRVLGLAVYNPPRIFLARDLPDAQQFETLVHEYMHQLSTAAAGGDVRPTLEGVFRLEGPARTLLRERGLPPEAPITPEIRIAAGIKARTEELRAEFLQMTDNLIAQMAGVSLKEARDVVRGQLEYFGKDDELLSRAAELMFLDPMTARRVAPRAFRLMSRFINRESPKMRMLISRGDLRNIDDWLQGTLVREERRIFETAEFKLSPAQAMQYTRTGVFRGMEAFVDGRPVETLRRAGERVFIRDSATGTVGVVPFEKLQRPVFPQLAERSRELVTAIEQATNRLPNWVGVLLTDVAADGVRKGVLDLRNFEVVRGGTEGLIRFIERNRIEGGLNRIDIALGFVRGRGKDGILLEDRGALFALLANERSLTFADDVLYEGLERVPDALLGSTTIPISARSLFESLLRDAGATERELPRLVRLAEREYGRRLMEIVDPEISEALLRGMESARGVADDVATAAQRSRLRTSKTTSGETRVHPQDSNVELARFATEEEANAYVTRAGSFDVTGEEIVAGSQVPTGSFFSAGGGPPPRIQAQDLAAPQESGSWLTTVINAVNYFAPVFTSLGSFAKSVEELGLGAAYSRVFRPLQDASRRVFFEMGAVPREALGGKTFDDQLRLIRDLASHVKKNRQETVVRYIESLSRQEVETAGGLLERGMTAEELKVAKVLDNLGMANEVPRLLSIERLARGFLGNRKKFLSKLNRMEATGVSDEVRRVLREIRQLTEVDAAPDTIEGIFDALGLSNEEKLAIDLLNRGRSLGKDTFSTFVVSRWLAAPELKSSFKNARAQFAAENKMAVTELKLAEELDRHFKAAFGTAGLDSKRELAGYWPHLRTYIENGLVPDNEFMRQILPPKSLGWSAQKFRSGELDVYTTDPVLAAYKHVRGLFMSKHFDPALKDVARPALRELKQSDPRSFRIMVDYVRELQGRPHASFKRVNQAIATLARVMGHPVPERLAERFVNGAVAMSYNAAIPFRAATILRNYFQMSLTPARIGPRAFFDGLETALTPEGYKEAVKHLAVPTGVVPLHAATEIFKPRFIGPLRLRMSKIFEAGLNWYKKPDDIGRAAAFHGMRSRASRHLPDYMAGRIDFETFKSRAKVNTFKETDVTEFERLFKAGQMQEGIDFLGARLADEVHFTYGHANHPAGWGGIAGRLFGQFGTFPVQYKDFLLQGISRGSTKDKAEFLATQAATQLGLVAAGGAVGLNLWTWAIFPSLQYTGGPFVDMVADFRNVIGGTTVERRMALRSLQFALPTLADPRSIFVPGSYFIGDVWRAMSEREQDFGTILRAGGFKVVEPGDDPPFEWLFGQ